MTAPQVNDGAKFTNRKRAAIAAAEIAQKIHFFVFIINQLSVNTFIVN